MNDHTLTRVGVAGAILAGICCAAPLLVVGLPLAGFGAWLAGAGLVIIPLMLAAIALIAWGIHHRRATAAARKSKVHEESVKP
ncbi:mercuric ion transport protein [Bradyrhizobium sp. AZCC 1577]|uniref:mercury transport protein n=1 Tax=Bradyrhizobium sp. AZCC 1577 TaxID=3117019 RepID=UPI002FEEFD57